VRPRLKGKGEREERKKRNVSEPFFFCLENGERKEREAGKQPREQ